MMLLRFKPYHLVGLAVLALLSFSEVKAESGFDCRELSTKEELSFHERAFRSAMENSKTINSDCMEEVKARFLAYQKQLQILVKTQGVRLDHYLLVRITERHPEKLCINGHYQYGLLEVSEWERSQLDEWKARNKARFLTVALSFSSQNPKFIKIDKDSRKLVMRVENLGREPFDSNCGERFLSSK